MAPTVETATPYTLKAITYHVPSDSEPGLIHDVTVTDDRWSCDCKAGEFPKTRGHCWHIKSARNGLHVGKPRVRIQPVPPAPATCPHGRTPRLCAACAGPASVSDLYA